MVRMECVNVCREVQGWRCLLSVGVRMGASPLKATLPRLLWERTGMLMYEFRYVTSPFAGAVSLLLGFPSELNGCSPGGQLLVMGTGLQASAICALVERCGAGGGGGITRPPRAPESLTSAERATVAAQRTFDALPEGCCFDGSRYRDEFGDVLREHPHMDRWVLTSKASCRCCLIFGSFSSDLDLACGL